MEEIDLEVWLQSVDAAGERVRISRDAADPLSRLLLFALKTG